MSEKTENTNDDKKLYELGFHIVSSIAEEKVSDEVENLKVSLNKIDAEIVKEGEAQPIELAYTIVKKINEVNTKFDKAYFGWIKFNATAEGVESLKKEIDTNVNVLRYILVKTVDDDEHSTAKILTDEEEAAAKESEEAEADADDSEEAVEKTEEKVAEKTEEKSVDEAIDELVE
jgi:ribosomal protein S6